jgi:3-dehydroquinate dehydratase
MLLLKTTSFQVKVLQKKFTLLNADFSKIVLKYSNKVHLLSLLDATDDMRNRQTEFGVLMQSTDWNKIWHNNISIGNYMIQD